MQTMAEDTGGQFFGTSSPASVPTLALQLADIFAKQYVLEYNTGFRVAWIPSRSRLTVPDNVPDNGITRQ